MKRITVSIIDKKSRLEDKESLEPIVHKLLNNPFASFGKMDFDYKNKWDKPAHLDRAIKGLGKQVSRVAFGTRNPHFMKASLDKNQVQNTISLDMDQAYFEIHEYDVLRKYILGMAGLFKELYYVAIKTIPEISDYYLKYNIPTVASDSFRLYPNWIQFLIPEVYNKDFKKEDLLKCPAYRVTEHEGGIIEVQLFEDPFGYETPEVIDRFRETNRYLEEHLKPIN